MFIDAGKDEKLLNDVMGNWYELKNHKAKLSSSRFCGTVSVV
jgi:hypothetical protein